MYGKANVRISRSRNDKDERSDDVSIPVVDVARLLMKGELGRTDKDVSWALY